MSNIQLGAFDFALNLHREVNSLPKNGFSSPASILVTVAMCFFGTKGKTKLEIGQTLFGKQSQDQEISAHLSKLVESINKPPEEDFVLRSANRLYGQKGMVLKNQFQNSMQQIFKSEMIQSDFKNHAENERQKINTWVANMTNDRIKDLIPRGILDELTRLVLVNALYLKAKWLNQFPPGLTKDEKFHVSANKQIDVKMMSLNKNLQYSENDEYQMLQLEYKQPAAKMVIILPKEKFGLKNIVAHLNGQKLKTSLQAMATHKVDVKLPKFTIEQSFDLNEALKKLGIKEAFIEGKADFTEITDTPPLVISKVLHKSFIEVSENGTEAAAATAVIISKTKSLRIPPEYPKKSFIADHPFLFAILDQNNEHILFLGQYYAQ